MHEISGRDIDQVVIANHLGIALPTDRECSDPTEAGVISIRFDADPDRWGITPTPAEIDTVLKRVDLECRFEDVSRFQDWEFAERLQTLTASEQFPIVGFDYDSLFGGLGQEITGHCVVVYGSHETNGRTSSPQRRPVRVY